jgi:uncharacterized BrkB/YihY/UPF0761 family membrane protein
MSTSLRVRRRAVVGALATLVAALLLSLAMEFLQAHFAAGALLFVAAAVVFVATVLLVWRCPNCDRYLGRHLYPQSCSRCGIAFE